MREVGIDQFLDFSKRCAVVQARDAFYQCMKEGGVLYSSKTPIPSKCKQLRSKFESSCLSSWVSGLAASDFCFRQNQCYWLLLGSASLCLPRHLYYTPTRLGILFPTGEAFRRAARGESTRDQAAVRHNQQQSSKSCWKLSRQGPGLKRAHQFIPEAPASSQHPF